MRKAIPISLVLVALSLIGFVILQINWVYNTRKVQAEEIRYRTDKTVNEVADTLRKVSNTLNNLNYSVSRFSTSPLNLSTPYYIPISQALTINDIRKIIRAALIKNKIADIRFEYAVIYGGGINHRLEFSSTNFLSLFNRINYDTAFSNDTHPVSQIINSQPNEDNGIISINESVMFIVPDISSQAWHSLIWVFAGSALLTLITVSAFYLTVRNMLDQTKLSRIKSDFINNMTHEFKTPLATISLAVDALYNPKVQGNAEKTQYFSEIIKEENKRMNKLVETILQAAFMEKQDLQLNKSTIHVHEIINRLVNNFSLQLADKNGEAVTHLNAAKDLISGDEVHITNLINNLIDNAVKYSKPDVPPRIVITTTDSAKNLIIQIKDNGIGMSKDSVKRIFEKFYRAHTGNLHDVKGFGLGMSYVKDIIEAHKGKIKVDSILGKGTTFVVELPLA